MQQYYLIGSPVAHSLSPAMMNLSFEKTGVAASYGLREVLPDKLGEAVAEFRRDNVSGWNVTMPDKQAMSLLCDELSPESAIGGSVNTVKNENGRLIGYTTDGIGFMNAAARAGCPLRGEKFTLLGSGGAAGAILIQAALDGVSEISVFCNRPASRQRVEEIREKLREFSGLTVKICSYESADTLKSEIAESRALVNATNVGMAGRARGGPDTLIPDASYLHEGLFVYDIIYHPLVTPLLKLAASAGLPSSNGLSMLIGQGAESFRIWTGKQMPLDDVEQLILCHLRE